MSTDYCRICGIKDGGLIYWGEYYNDLITIVCKNCYLKLSQLHNSLIWPLENVTKREIERRIMDLFQENPEFFKLFILTGPPININGECR